MRTTFLAMAVGALLWGPLASAQDRRPAPHTISLPRLRPWPADRWWSAPDAVVGELPSTQHPRGTVLVFESAAEKPTPTLAEWDVMTGQLLRSVALPLPPEILRVKVVRAQDRIHVIAYEKPKADLHYIRLTSSLQVESAERLGTVDGMAMATDGSVVAILWCGTREGVDARGWQLVTLDATGRPLGVAFLSTEQVFVDGSPLAVMGRKVYVLLDDRHHSFPPIMRLSADASVEDHQSVSATPDYNASFAVVAGKLLLVNGCYFESVRTDWLTTFQSRGVPYPPQGDPWCPAFEVASDPVGRLATSKGDVLSAASLRIERHFASPGGYGERPLWIGSVPALLALDGKTGGLWLTWSD